MKNLMLAFVAVAVTATSIFAHDGHGDGDNIVGVAVGNKDFSTLVAAVKAANLVVSLNHEKGIATRSTMLFNYYFS